jgi:hypothetical protein
MLRPTRPGRRGSRPPPSIYRGVQSATRCGLMSGHLPVHCDVEFLDCSANTMSDGDTPLTADLSEAVNAAEKVKTILAPVRGLVAILDALGTKLLSLDEAIRFVGLRDSIMAHTAEVLETKLPALQKSRLNTFTLNDTLIYAYAASSEVTLDDVEGFCHLLRVAETLSIAANYPFRGAFAVGDYFVGDTQTVLGPAVSDAASWFEAAEWIGVHATPHATMFIQSLREKQLKRKLEHVLLDYEVPLKTGQKQQLKCINWPKGFYIRDLRPPGEGTTRGIVLASLTKRRVPKDTERKYFNAVDFFDYVEKLQTLESRSQQGFSATDSASPSIK